MKQNWENHLAAWHLAEAGRWEEALDAAGACPDLHALLSQRAFRPINTADAVIIGWQCYYQGLYREALGHFHSEEMADACDGPGGWRRAWSRLGIAKVASDSGHWKSALGWCAAAWILAAEEEHLDLLAQIAGARGEILLRAGKPLDAAAAFAEDRALLPPGSRYHGRVRSYEAHAWARLGPNGRAAATLAYRMALHSPGEAATAGYAAAGLALLAAREDHTGWNPEEWSVPATGLPQFWLLVVKARACPSAETLRQAAETLPAIHFAEHWWLANWSRSMGINGPPAPDLRDVFPESIPPPPQDSRTLVEEPVDPGQIPDAPWWTNKLPQTPDQWWRIRDCFMP